MAEIGSILREARMRAHIDISEVEARTKIRAKYLRALENEEWDLLPGPVYVKSFVKTYGDYLGLDSRLLVDEFKRRYERPMEYEGRATTTTTTTRERDRRAARRPSRPSRISAFLFSPRSVIVMALIVIVLAVIVIGSHNDNNNTAGGPTTPTTSTVTPKHHSKPAHGGTTTNPGSHTGTTVARKTTPPAAPKKATLALVTTGTVWVCVENQAGKVLVPGVTYTAGKKIPTKSGKTLLVTLGNGDVNLTVNGKPYKPGGADPIGLKITPKGGAKPLSPSPTCNT